jgi:putative peptidoglycan lipid II flippase
MSEAATVLSQPADDETPTLPGAKLPADTVLARRYRLEELIRESPPTVTWRAFDQVLSRSVLVHLLAPEDPNAEELLTVARKASVATDSRFLRVLDVVHSESPEIGSYIVSEYALGQSLEMILARGPLSGLEAAWVVREVADALAGVHNLRVYHERINPETVIITPDGNVKIVGLLIEAALRPPQSTSVHGADTPEHIDVLDMGRLLYACLVCRWPGGPAYGLPDAPVHNHRWATPRQVRAGVSPTLDNVCDQILGDPPRHKASPITTANGLIVALSKVLGPADASGDLERRLRQTRPTSGPGDGAGPSAEAPTIPAAPAVSATTQVTQPVPEAAPRRADQTTVMQPVSQPRTRKWIPAALVLLLVVVAGIATVVAFNNPPGTSGSPAESGPISIVGARDFDPQGDDRTENPELVKNAYDGDPATGWRTVQYRGNPELGGIKRGVGLVFDLGSAQPVRSVKLTFARSGTHVELRVPRQNPETVSTPPMSSDGQWRRIASEANAGQTATLTADQPVSTRYVLVYLTSLPKEGADYRGRINEVAISR